MRSSYQIHKMNTIYKSREVLECMCSWEGQVKTKISLVESDTSKLDDHLLPKRGGIQSTNLAVVHIFSNINYP